MVKAYSPANLKEALDIKRNEQCIVFAGGTDLMVKNKHWTIAEAEKVKNVIFVSDLKELKEIKIEKGNLSIGASCTLSQIIENQLVPEFLKGVLCEMASPAIRNTATIGGNICNSSPAGDSIPYLYAVDAMLLLENSMGERKIPMGDFIVAPGKNILDYHEILTKIILPLEDFDIKEYRKVGTRKSTALSKLSFTGLARAREGKLLDIRLAFGAVGPTVIRSRAAEIEIIKMYCSSSLNISSIRAMYEDLIKPIDDQRSTAFYRFEACMKLLEDFILNKVVEYAHNH